MEAMPFFYVRSAKLYERACNPHIKKKYENK